ncbi:hypothetical protein [Phormidesmis priestleyi]|uniref:hypothetical protein n=1 Tax=Phormidesmis priestleyi TaxID=268141 RepID=UPI000A8402A8|nr:hypothetical protein [Phormidesmis priestleyi]
MLKLALIVLVRHEQGVALEPRFIVSLSAIAGGFMSSNHLQSSSISILWRGDIQGFAVHLGRSGVKNSD